MKENKIFKSHRPAIGDHDLNKFLAAAWIQARSNQDTTELQLMKYVENRSMCKASGEELYLVDNAARTL